MVTTLAMVLSFPEKSTTCREQKVNTYPGMAPQACAQAMPVHLGCFPGV